MFVAIGKDKKRVSIEDAIEGEEYFCPVCNNKLSIKAQNSTSVKMHFAHKQGTDCLDNWKYDMSEWHYNWQECFPIECREQIIEKNGEIHRADAIFKNTIFEFQHSPISYEDFTTRNKFYINCGYKVVWIFDANKKIKSIEPIIDNNFYCYNDCVERQFDWKRVQDVFKNFCAYPPKTVAIYLEVSNENTKLLVPLKKVDPLLPTAYYLNPPLSPKSILKEYQLISDEDVLSISQTMESTRKIQENIRYRMLREIKL